MTTTDALRERLVGRRPSAREALWAWIGPMLAMVVGGFLRFWELGRPHQLVFDETYYVKQGWSMWQYGYERRANPAFDKKHDEMFTNGTWDVWTEAGDKVVHGPVGKWMIGLGEAVTGIDNSIGWRLAVCIMGTLSILMVGRAAWRMFRSATLATVASVLLAFEGHHFVQSRTGLLDMVIMFFALAAFNCLLIDRDRSRERLATTVGAVNERRVLGGTAATAMRSRRGSTARRALSRMGPFLGAHPWRWAAGFFLGATIGTKWSGMYFLAVFGLMTVFWDMGARRAAGVRKWFSGSLVKDAPLAFVAMVGTAAVTYFASWFGWFRSEHAYSRNWLAELRPQLGEGAKPTGSHLASELRYRWVESDSTSWLPDSIRNFLHYHREMWDFHVGLTSSHPYQSNPWSWMIQSRPTSFYYETKKLGEQGCAVDECSKAILPVGNPAVWWVATALLAVLLFRWALKRDWRAGAALSGLAAGWLPWFMYQERTIYTFYTVAFVPWVVLIVTYGAGMALGSADAALRRRQIGLGVVTALCVSAILLFAYFWPIYTAQVIPKAEWAARIWFPSWT